MKRRDFIASSGAILGASLLKPSESLSQLTAREYLPAADEGTNEMKANAQSATVSMTLDQIHQAMEHFCQDEAGNAQVGSFFLVSWLVANIKNDFTNAQQYTKDLSYPTPFPKINAALEIDPRNINLSIVSGEITLDKFSPVIVYKEPGPNPRPYNRIAIDFAPLRLKLSEDPTAAGKLRFYITTADPKNPDYPRFKVTRGTPNSKVLADNQIDAKDYDRAEAVIEVSAAPIDIITSFVASLPVLGIVEAMRQFGIGDPMRFDFAGDLVIVHGPSMISSASPCGPGAGTKVTSAISAPHLTPPNTANGSNGFKMVFNHAVEPVDAFQSTANAVFGYYYPLEWSFKDFGIGVVSPGVSASDRGDFALFHWEYHASARPKPNSVTVQINDDPSTHLPELKIKIDCPFDVGGAAGVSMKVGCVTVPLLSTSILGHIENPSEFTLKFALANTSSGPAVVVTANYDCNVDIAFYNPPMIDVLLNVLMGSFGNRLVAGELRRLVNSLNFPLIDLNGLAYAVGNDVQPWRLGQNFHKKSALLGLEQGRRG